MREPHLDHANCFFRVVVPMQVELRVLVRGEKGEQGTAVPTAELHDAFRAGLFVDHAPLSACGTRVELYCLRTSGLRQSFSSGNSFCSHARSLKKLSGWGFRRSAPGFQQIVGAGCHTFVMRVESVPLRGGIGIELVLEVLRDRRSSLSLEGGLGKRLFFQTPLDLVPIRTKLVQKTRCTGSRSGRTMRCESKDPGRR